MKQTYPKIPPMVIRNQKLILVRNWKLNTTGISPNMIMRGKKRMQALTLL